MRRKLFTGQMIPPCIGEKFFTTPGQYISDRVLGKIPQESDLNADLHTVFEADVTPKETGTYNKQVTKWKGIMK